MSSRTGGDVALAAEAIAISLDRSSNWATVEWRRRCRSTPLKVAALKVWA